MVSLILSIVILLISCGLIVGCSAKSKRLRDNAPDFDKYLSEGLSGLYGESGALTLKEFLHDMQPKNIKNKLTQNYGKKICNLYIRFYIFTIMYYIVALVSFATELILIIYSFTHINMEYADLCIFICAIALCILWRSAVSVLFHIIGLRYIAAVPDKILDIFLSEKTMDIVFYVSKLSIVALVDLLLIIAYISIVNNVAKCFIDNDYEDRFVLNLAALLIYHYILSEIVVLLCSLIEKFVNYIKRKYDRSEICISKELIIESLRTVNMIIMLLCYIVYRLFEGSDDGYSVKVMAEAIAVLYMADTCFDKLRNLYSKQANCKG